MSHLILVLHYWQALLCEAALAPDDAEGRLLPKAILQLSLHSVSDATLAILDFLLLKVEAELTDKNGIKQLSKVKDRLQGMRSARADVPLLEIEPAKVEALAQSLLESQRMLRDADAQLATARQLARGREIEDANSHPRLTPKKEKRKLAKMKGTPRHLGHANENSASNVLIE